MRRILVAILVTFCLASLEPAASAAGRCGGRAADFAVCVRVRCAGLAGRAGHACRRACRPARIRTLVYAVTDCQQREPSSLTGTIRLFVRRGECEPVALPGPALQTVPDPLGNACRRFLGETRFGPNEIVGGVIERLGVSVDGTRIVFEMTDDFSSVAGLLPPEQEGFFIVRPDGSDLRRLGPASRASSWRLGFNQAFPLRVLARFDDRIPFSPDGRQIAFADVGPSLMGAEAPQLFTLDLATGARTQVTHLEPVPLTTLDPAVAYISFVDDDTLLFFSSANPDGADAEGLRAFTVQSDGTRLRALPSPIEATGGSRVVPLFSITGPGTSLLDLHQPGMAANSYRGYESPIAEVFFLDGKNLLQLTNYTRWDTGAEYISRSGRLFFHASADPVGDNPTGNCQLFSIDRLGRHLRQVTHFAQGERSENGCFFGQPPGCDVRFAAEDPVTGSVVFYSSCDPYGTNPNGGQIFAMRPDGSGLRQLTKTRGFALLPDGTATVEIPGPFAYSARPLGTFPK